MKYNDRETFAWLWNFHNFTQEEEDCGGDLPEKFEEPL